MSSSVIDRAAATKRLARGAKKPTARKAAAKKAAPPPLELKSGSAILDVMGGRDALRRHVRVGRVVPVVIRGVIDREYSADDGISQEYCVCVEAVEVGEPRRRGRGSYE
jgi:hypothetical protein